MSLETLIMILIIAAMRAQPEHFCIPFTGVCFYLANHVNGLMHSYRSDSACNTLKALRIFLRGQTPILDHTESLYWHLRLPKLMEVPSLRLKSPNSCIPFFSFDVFQNLSVGILDFFCALEVHYYTTDFRFVHYV